MTLYRKLYSVYEESVDDDRCTMPLYEEIKQVEKRYQHHVTIGEGGMKIVYKVYDQVTSRSVALATLQEHSSVECYDLFIREARLTALLHHPNIIPIHDIGIGSNGVPFFTMELKEGRSLQEIVDAVKRDVTKDDTILDEWMGFDDRLQMFLKVCDAMAYAHSQKIGHGDLKPSNIQVGQFGEVMVCDWGLGRILGEANDGTEDELLYHPDTLRHITLNGSIKGTPGYMSPEQCCCEPLSRQSDIFSLGCVLYAVVFGNPPFMGELEFCLGNTKNGHFHFPKSMGVASGLKAVIETCLKASPDQRYGSVEDLQRDVRSWMAHHVTTVEKAGVFRQTQLLIKRNTKVFSVASLSLLILVFMGVYFYVHLKIRHQEAEAQKLYAEVQKGIAKDARSLYNEERQWRDYTLENFREGLRDLSIEQLFFTSLEPEESYGIDRALMILDRMVEASPNDRYFRASRGRAHVYRQDFNAALRDFEHAKSKSKKDGSLFELAKKYSTMVGVGPILDPELQKAFVQDASQAFDQYSVFKVYNYRRHNGISFEENLRFIKGILRQRNPTWDPETFQYQADQNVLSVDMEGISYMGYRFYNKIKERHSFHHLFSFLPLTKVVFKNLNHYNDEILFYIKVNEVDLSHPSNLNISFETALRFKYISTFMVRPENAQKLKDKELPMGMRFISSEDQHE